MHTVAQHGRQIVLMQKYMRRHLIRTKMRRKRRAGIGKVTKFKTCQRVMRGYLGRRRADARRQANHAADETADFGAGLYRNALVHERDRMIVRTMFSLQRDRARVDRRRLRQREVGSYGGAGGGNRSTDEESCRLAGPLVGVFRRFCDMPTKSDELGSMKFAKFCKTGCHNLVLDLQTARAQGFKTEKRALSRAAGGRFGHVRGTDIDLAHSKALADMADLEMELEAEKASSQRPSSRERKKRAGLDLDGFCRALIYVARSRYLDGHRPESRPGSRGGRGSSRPGSRGSKAGSSRPGSPDSRGGRSRPGTPNNRPKKPRGRSLERQNSRGRLSRPSSRGSNRGGGGGGGGSRSPSRPGTPSQFMASLSRPGSRQSERSFGHATEGEHDPDDPTYIRGHTDDEALVIRLCDEHVFGGPLPSEKKGAEQKKRRKKKKRKQKKTMVQSEEGDAGDARDSLRDAVAGALVEHFPSPSSGAVASAEKEEEEEKKEKEGVGGEEEEEEEYVEIIDEVDGAGGSSPTSPSSPSSRPSTPSNNNNKNNSPGSPHSPPGTPSRKTKKRRHSVLGKKKPTKHALSVSSQSRVALDAYCAARADWAANVVQRAIRGLFGRNLYSLAVRARANFIRDRERGRQATILQCRWRQRAAKRAMVERFRTVVIKYIDPVSTRPYWHNPTLSRATGGMTVWTKPRLLVEFGGDEYDVRKTVKLPFPDVEYSKQCDNCSDLVVSRWCYQCDEYYCATCSEELHHHGKKKAHDRFPFDVCIECEYQVASRRCNECSDTYCDTCFWRAHSKGNLKLHTWSPLVELCRFCTDPNTAVATRVDVQGALADGAQSGMFADAVDAGAQQQQQQQQQQQGLGDGNGGEDGDGEGGGEGGGAHPRLFPENDHMCLRCYNTSWYSQGYGSAALDFRVHAVEKEKQRIAAEKQSKADAEAKQRRVERDERRRVVALVTRLQANYRRRKTGHLWGARLMNHHADIVAKARFDKIEAQKEKWWYKVQDATDAAPVLESDTFAERKRKLVPRRLKEVQLRRMYPWMPESQSELCPLPPPHTHLPPTLLTPPTPP
jgi:hypothetical protein